MLNDIWRETERLMEHIETVEPGTDEYDKVLGEIRDFIHLQNTVLDRQEFESWTDKLLKNSAFVGGVFTLGATALVLYFERLDIITSRAFGWMKFR